MQTQSTRHCWLCHVRGVFQCIICLPNISTSQQMYSKRSGTGLGLNSRGPYYSKELRAQKDEGYANYRSALYDKDSNIRSRQYLVGAWLSDDRLRPLAPAPESKQSVRNGWRARTFVSG